jgi:hypothetical protein
MASYETQRGPDEPFWDDDELEIEEPIEAAAGPSARRRGAADPDLDPAGEEETGHSWAQSFHDPVREPYGGPGGSGEIHPYGGQRFAWGREGGPHRGYGQLYGYQERGYGHRRDSYYARAGATPWWEIDPEPEADASGGSFAGVGSRGYKRPDLRIEEEVVQRLEDAEWVDATDVEVEVADGVVTLAGEVETRAERRAAEDIAAEVAGVVDVINRLRARQQRRGTPS